MINRLLLSLGVLFMTLTAPLSAALPETLKSSGVQGGLVVHLNCGDGQGTATLLTSDRLVVHGLDTDAANVAKGRKFLQGLGVYGKVSLAVFDGKSLPYVDNLVNLVISEGKSGVSEQEIMRVLAPLGVAMIGDKKLVKPWPANIDDWSHHFQGADNNPVAMDTVVGTPRGLQWVCEPRWARSHEFLSSVSAMVSGEGRLFYIFDEGLTAVHTKDIPERWKLIARDAFNGKLLWKQTLQSWGTKSWKARGLRNTPGTAQRRMAVGGGRIYVTLGFSAPVSAVDAATGEIVATYDETENTQQIHYLGGVLLARTPSALVAIDTNSGRKLWDVQGEIEQDMVAASGASAYFIKEEQLVCRGLKDGKDLWTASDIGPAQHLIVDDNRVIVIGKKDANILDAATGKVLRSIYVSPSRRASMFVLNGQLWNTTTGYDLETGKKRTEVSAENVKTPGHHPRCYPCKATENFFIGNNRGTEFISLTGGENVQNDWTRGPCTFGVLPCNGLLYAAPDPCFCYPGVKMTGFNVYRGTNAPKIEGTPLQKGPAYGKSASVATTGGWPTYRASATRHGSSAAVLPTTLNPAWKVNLGGRLTQPVIAAGRVYVVSRDTHTVHTFDEKSGEKGWTYTADARIDSPPTVVGDQVLFGCTDGKVYCLRASDGALAWRFRAALSDQLIMDHGQLESPWRVHGSVLAVNGLVYCTAGRSTNLDGGILIYALDPKTGEVKHQVQLDTWSPTRKDAIDKPFIPGYHMEGAFSDVLTAEGGFIYMGQYKLDLALQQQDAPYVMPNADKKSEALGREDLMNAEYVAGMNSMAASEERQRKYQWGTQKKMMEAYTKKYGGASMGDRKMGRRVFATGGFLDDQWYNRTFWMYSETWPGFYIANRAAKTGQLLTVDTKQTYAVHAFPIRNLQSPLFEPQTKGYLLVADNNENEPCLPEYTRGVPKGIGFTRKNPPAWHQWVPIRIRAMLAADNALFIAGAPDLLSKDDPMAAFEGRKGAALWAVAKETGKKISEVKLDSPPVFDGMSAANGRLFISTLKGELHCFGR